MPPKIKAKRTTIEEYTPATLNPNKGKEGGVQVIENSIVYAGTGRSGLSDKHGKMIAGSHTLEAMKRAGITNVIEVEAARDEWVVVKRPDLDLATDDEAIVLQLSDNQATALGYEPDEAVISQMLEGKTGEYITAAGFGDQVARLLQDQQDQQGSGRGGWDDEGEALASDGSLLAATQITIADPKHAVEKGQVWRVAEHLLCCASVVSDFGLWAKMLVGEKTRFVPYPGPYITLVITDARFVMVQPDPYICGHILDRYAEIRGEESIERIH